MIADIHFNASLALKAIEQGVAAVRINPGNIGGPDKVELVVKAAKKAGIPMRIGANSGSLPKHLAELAQHDQAEALVEAALEEVRLLEELDFREFKISRQVEPRADDDPRLPDALGEGAVPAPPRRHRGGHARSPARSRARSAWARCSSTGSATRSASSLTADPVEEPKTGFEILKALGLRERGPMMIACPSCGRDNVGVHTARRGGRGAAARRTRSTSRSPCSAAP